MNIMMMNMNDEYDDELSKWNLNLSPNKCMEKNHKWIVRIGESTIATMRRVLTKNQRWYILKPFIVLN